MHQKDQEQLHLLALGEQTNQTQVKGAALRAKLDNVYSYEDIFGGNAVRLHGPEKEIAIAFFHAAATSRKT